MTDFHNTARALFHKQLKDGLPVALEHPEYRWKKGHVLIAGEAHSGKTNALIRTMVNMVKATKGDSGTPIAVVIASKEESASFIYRMIASHLTQSNMYGEEIDCEQFVDTWMDSLGFQVTVHDSLESAKERLKKDYDAFYVFVDTSGMGGREALEEVAAMRDLFVGPLVFTMPLHRHRESNELQSNIPADYKAAVSGEEQSRIVSGADLAVYTTAHPDGSVRLNFLRKPDDATEDSFQLFTDPLSKERAYIAQQRVKEPECGPQ